jgi:hypothetical protein
MITKIQAREAFWNAARQLEDDPEVHGMNVPYMDEERNVIDTSGTPGLPDRFWVHFARQLNQ